MIWTLQWVAGQLFDAMVGRVVNVLGAPWTQRSGGRGRSGVYTSLPAAVWEPRGAVETRAAAVAKDVDLEGDAIKLVRYGIVSLRPCHERLLPDGAGEVLVTLSMTGEVFATWIIACYLQAEDHPEAGRDAAARRRRNELQHAEKRYLRVAYEVLCRWPSEPLDCCETRELHALQGIRDAILELHPPLLAAVPAPPASIVTAVPPAVDEELPTTVEPIAEEEKPNPVLQALLALGGEAQISKLIRQTELSRNRVRQSLRALMDSGQVRRSGEGKDTRYHAVTEGE